MELNLLVLRSKQPKALSLFYENFGLEFVYHRHGNGPFHYSTNINGLVLEIYPLMNNQEEIDRGLRLGFTVANLGTLVESLQAAGVEIVSFPQTSPWGRRCVIRDIEGRKIELVER